jgi:hypothetical protein
VRPDQRSAAVEAAKRAAVPFVNCVTARVPPEHLIAGKTWEELAALAIVLAAATDLPTLYAVIAEPDDGIPDPVMRETALVWAHREYQRQHLNGAEPGDVLRQLERDYRKMRRQGVKAAKEVA